jgi:hypothetical protein
LLFQNTLTIGDVLNFVLLLITALTLVFAIRQIRSGYIAQKAAFFKELYLLSTSDPDIRDAFLLIEYDEFVYDDHFHQASPHERKIDAMVNFYDLLCDLYFQRILTEHEMEAFRPNLLRVYQNKHIRNYLKFLSVFYRTSGYHGRRADAFLRYGEEQLQRLLRANKPNELFLTVDDAIVFYEEQKGKLDDLLRVAEGKLSPADIVESPVMHKIRAVDSLNRNFQILFAEQQASSNDPVERDQRTLELLKQEFQGMGSAVIPATLREAIDTSGVYDPSRLIIGLEALRAKLLAEENRRAKTQVHHVPDKISMKHLFSHWDSAWG